MLQVNTSMRLKALAEIYTMHSFAQLSDLNLLSKSYLFFEGSFSFREITDLEVLGWLSGGSK